MGDSWRLEQAVYVLLLASAAKAFYPVSITHRAHTLLPLSGVSSNSKGFGNPKENPAPRSPKQLTPIMRPHPPVASASAAVDGDLTLKELASRFADVQAHFRDTKANFQIPFQSKVNLNYMTQAKLND